MASVLLNSDAPDCLLSEFIDHNSMTWLFEKLQEYFDLNTVMSILAIPLNNSPMIATLFWGHNRNGKYSVKSEYWLGMLGAPVMNAADTSQLRPKMWGVQGPPKMLHFIWRACKDSLLVKAVRFRRHMSPSDICTRCNEATKSVCHALLDCEASRDMWLVSPHQALINTAPRSSFDTFFLWLHSHSLKDEMALICSALWAYWFCRNRFVMESKNFDLLQLTNAMNRTVTEYQAYAKKVFNIPVPKMLSYQSWQPPERGWCKINFDAYIGSDGSRGLGVVLRNDQGCVVLTSTRKVRANWDVETIEAIAALYALDVAKRMNFSMIHLEGDALKVITAISHQFTPLLFHW